MKIMKMMMMKPPQNGPTLYCKRYLALTFLNLFSFLLSLSLIGVCIMMMKIEAGSDRVVQSVPLHISLVHISHHISLCPLPILLYYTVCTATNLSSYVYVSPRFHLPDGHQTLTTEHTQSLPLTQLMFEHFYVGHMVWASQKGREGQSQQGHRASSLKLEPRGPLDF